MDEKAEKELTACYFFLEGVEQSTTAHLEFVRSIKEKLESALGIPKKITPDQIKEMLKRSQTGEKKNGV